MRGYRLLDRSVYTLVFALTAALLFVNFLATLVGLWSFGSLFWWPAFALVVVVLALEGHSFYVRNLA